MTLDEITEWAHQIIDEMDSDEIADILWMETGPVRDVSRRFDAAQAWIADIYESDDTGIATLADAEALYRIVSDTLTADGRPIPSR